MRVYSDGQEAPKSSALARLIAESPKFHTSDLNSEKNSIITEVMDELYAYAVAAAPAFKAQQKYSRITNKCMKEDGGVVMNAALRHFERKQSRPEESMEAAEDALEEALTLQLIECVLEALYLAGVTDAELIPEICRCVIEGGKPFDGKGFGTVNPEQESLGHAA